MHLKDLTPEEIKFIKTVSQVAVDITIRQINEITEKKIDPNPETT